MLFRQLYHIGSGGTIIGGSQGVWCATTVAVVRCME